MTRALAAGQTQAAGLRRDGSIRIWKLEQGGPIGNDPIISTPHSKSLRGAVFSPFKGQGNDLATWGVDHTEQGGDRTEIKVWEGRTGQLLRTHRDIPVSVVAFAPSGKIMASAGSDRRVRLWASDTGHVLRTLEGHRGSIAALGYAPDGRWLATDDTRLSGRLESSSGRIGWREAAGEVKLWDAVTGTLVQTFTGSRHGVSAVAISPDGLMVAGGTYWTGVTHIWDIKTGATLRSVGVFNVGVTDIQFSPNGKTLAIVGSDGIIRLWDVTR